MIVLLPLTEALLRTIGFNRTSSLLWRQVTPSASSLSPIEIEAALRRHARLMAKVGLLLPVGRCLARSLVLARTLQGIDIPVDLIFGQSRTEEKLNAHAWIEYHGVPVNEAANIAERYLPFRTPVLGTEQTI